MYSDIILALYKNPKHFGTLKDFTHRGGGYNPLCGDKIAMEASLDKNNHIKEIRFTGDSCAISRASASLLLEYAHGKDASALLKLKNEFMKELIEIPISAGRIKCLLLPLEVLHKTIKNKK